MKRHVLDLWRKGGREREKSVSLTLLQTNTSRIRGGPINGGRKHGCHSALTDTLLLAVWVKLKV